MVLAEVNWSVLTAVETELESGLLNWLLNLRTPRPQTTRLGTVIVVAADVAVGTVVGTCTVDVGTVSGFVSVGYSTWWLCERNIHNPRDGCCCFQLCR